MQPTTLLNNLNSDYLAAFSALYPSVGQRVLVYVESDDDISFWRGILAPFETNGVNFDIQLPIKNALEKGKIEVLKFSNAVGKHLILCVDSDYDYLLGNTTEISSLINTNPYIFQTYTYSIENLICYAPNLHSVCVHSSKNDTRIIVFEELMKLYSKIINPLFLWSVYFALKKDTTSFALKNFCEIIKIFEKADISENFSAALQELETRINAKVQTLEIRFPTHKHHVESLTEELNLLGINDTNVYLFVHGHTIKDNVVMVFIKKVAEELSRQKRTQINQILDEKVKKDQRNYYQKQIIPIEIALNSNTDYKYCFLYDKIKNKLNQYIQEFNGI